MIKTNKLAVMTKRELEIMNLLWKSSSSMTASEIASSVTNMTSNTAQAILRKMLRNGLIVIEKIVYNHTVLCRSFSPAFTKEDYLLAKLSYNYNSLSKNTSKTSIVSAMLNSDFNSRKQQDELIQLKEMLNTYKTEVVKTKEQKEAIDNKETSDNIEKG